MATSRENKTISQFKSALIGGGARPNLFEVEMANLPANVASVWDANIFRFMCKAAALPAQNIASIDVPFRGRMFKVAGDRNFGLRRALEEWTEQIASLDTNIGATDPSAYMVNAKVYQLGRGSTPSSKDNTGTSNSVLAEYEFIDIFPTNVSDIALSYDSGDTIEEFTVEFQVQSISILTGSNTPNG